MNTTRTHWLVAATVVAGLAAAAPADNDPVITLGEQVASAYGIEHWDKVEQLDFTFNVKLPGRDQPIVRKWTWRPQAGQVTLHRDDGSALTIQPANINDKTPEAVRKVHAQFINDSYWLLFPFQLVWSTQQITDQGQAPLPIGEGRARKLTVQYPDEGGYTPGDAYDIFVDDNMRIIQWIYRPGGGEAGKPATWEDNHQLGPIIVSLLHKNAAGSFKLWFTNVSATLTGEAEVAKPAPAASDSQPRGIVQPIPLSTRWLAKHFTMVLQHSPRS